MTNPSYSEQLSAWASDLTFDDLPGDVVSDASLRVLDILGTTLAASSFENSYSV